MQIAELKFGDVGRGLGHYRPVALAVGAIVVMAIILPGPRRVALDDFGASQWTGSTSAVVAGPTDQAEVPAEAAAAFDVIDEAPVDLGSSFRSFAAPVPSASTFTSDAFVTREDPAVESGSATFDSSPPAVSRTDTTMPAPAGPLRVTRSAWASAQAGTPLATTGVPAGSLPVGRRPGFQVDKVSFVKLSGAGTSLSLAPHGDANGARNAGSATVQVCRITAPGWAPGEGQSMAEAPKWDCSVAVLGKRSDDGSWTFDLSPFDDRNDDRGFALLPAGSGLDFQVAFLPG